MIIDPTKHFHPNYRPYTSLSAVAAVLSEMKVGAVLDIEALLDASGNTMPMNRLQTTISQSKGDAVFQTRKAPAPMLATIRRIA